MEKPQVAIESLRMRAEEFRVRAAECAIPHYSEMMRKGAAQLDEQASIIEARTASQLPVDFEMLLDIKGMDR